MSSNAPLTFACLALCPAMACAALNPRAVQLNVTSSSKQSTTVTSRRSDGQRDRTTTRIQILQIECRNVGAARPEAAMLRWYFISKDPLNGKFYYHAAGSKDVTIPAIGSLKTSAVADPMQKDQYTRYDGLRQVNVTAADVPAGWVVMVVQGGQVIKQTGSTPGMIQWVQKNPPD